MERRFLRIPILISFAVLFTGCSSGPQLRMLSSRPPVDESVLAPELKTKKIQRVVVLPPQGAARGYYDGIIALFEKQLLRNGLQLVSNESLLQRGGKVPVAEAPDAVIELSDWRWSKDVSPRRFFIFDEAGQETFKEVSQSVYQNANTYKVSFPALELRFLGRLTDASTGELLATFDLRCPVNFNLPGHYVAGIELMPDRPVIKSESFVYGSPNWFEEARKLSEAVLVKTVVDKLPRQEARKPASVVETTTAPPISLESPATAKETFPAAKPTDDIK